MTHQFDYEEATGLLRVSISGRLDMVGVDTVFGQLSERLQERECRCVLTDLRSAELDLSLIDLFHIAGRFARNRANCFERRAIVLRGAAELVTFYETTTANRGQSVRVFDDVDAARAWLFGTRVPAEPAAAP